VQTVGRGEPGADAESRRRCRGGDVNNGDVVVCKVETLGLSCFASSSSEHTRFSVSPAYAPCSTSTPAFIFVFCFTGDIYIYMVGTAGHGVRYIITFYKRD